MSVEMKHAKNTNSAQPVVISYLRFSRPEQLKGDSIRRQLALGEEWAGRHKMKVADTFRDQGVSAFRGKNAEEGSLARLLGLIDSGSIPRGSVLLVEQLDRLSRNAVLEALELFLSIIRRGIKVVTLMDGQEYDKDSLIRNMMQLQYSIMMMSLAQPHRGGRACERDAARTQAAAERAWTKSREGHYQYVESSLLPCSWFTPATYHDQPSKQPFDDPDEAMFLVVDEPEWDFDENDTIWLGSTAPMGWQSVARVPLELQLHL